VIPIPGSRDAKRVEENGSSAELNLLPDDLKALQELVEAADVQGDHYPAEFEYPKDSMPLSEWKGE
jgi:diketogulonate reductase-like aldo/keto reductase